jgi:hypothetical protein
MFAAPLLTALAACQSPTDRGAGMQEQISMVFFTEDSAAMGAEARATLAKAVTRTPAPGRGHPSWCGA